MREKYESLSLSVLRDLARARGLKGISALKKAELIERMLEEDDREKGQRQENGREEHERAESVRTDGEHEKSRNFRKTDTVTVTASRF